VSTPTDEDILAAERRVAAARERTRAAVYELRANAEARKAQLKTRMTRPSVLVYAFAIGIVLGKTLLKRKPRMPAMPRRRANEMKSGLAATLAAVMSRVGWRFVSAALMKMWSAPKRLPPPATRRPAQPLAVAPVIHSPPRSAGETVH